ncbi:zinc-binding dehydrogenase [Tepidimicrobium xylanilyticum]
MKAAIWYGQNNIEVKDITEPKYKEGDLLLQVICCNICGSDIRTYRHGSNSIKPGTVLGHEFVAKVIDATNCDGFSEGDLVIASQDIPCGECWYCTNGYENVCENKLEIGKDFQGAFAKKIVLPEVILKKGWVRKLNSQISIDAGSLIEPVASCLHTQKLLPPKEGDNVVIIGAGPIGCMHGELAKHAGADKVIMADLSSSRLEIAEKFNFDKYINSSKEDLVQVIREMFPFGVDRVISANPSVDAVRQAVEMVRKKGVVIAFGGFPKANYMVELDGNRIHYDEVVVIGSYAYSREECDEAMDLIRKGAISVDNYISRRFPLEAIEEAMVLATKAEVMKIQIRLD